MHEVERSTAPIRARMAHRHELQAERASLRLLELQLQWSGEIDGTMSITGLRERRAAIHALSIRKRWHAVRMDAQLQRFDRVAECGRHVIRRSCDDCGADRCAPVARCRSVLLCYDCRTRQQAKYRTRIREGMDRALSRARRDGRSYKGARPRFLTMTAPHSGSPVEDAALLARAWPRFHRAVTAYLQHERGWSKRQVSSLYVRRLEATPSDGGHMHYHAWVVWPFIPRALLAHWWGAAMVASGAQRDRERSCPCCRSESSSGPHGVRLVCLNSALERCSSELQREQLRAAAVTRRGPHGRALLDLWEPILSVQLADSDKAADELAKYICKDIGDDGELLDPETFARLFLAFCGRRTVSATRGLLTAPLPEPVPEWCEECGSYHFTTRMVPSAALATGPP